MRSVVCKSQFLLGMLVLCLPLTAGCGGGASGPPLAKVTGVVTLDGNPVEGATISFVPKGEGAMSLALTDPEGKFAMRTAAGKEGAVVGDHTITVSLSVTTGGGATGSADDLAPPQSFEGGAPAEAPKTLFLVPEKYGSPTTSGLTVTVPSGGLSDYAVELKSR